MDEVVDKAEGKTVLAECEVARNYALFIQSWATFKTFILIHSKSDEMNKGLFFIFAD